jgi:hypothetical protein
MVFTSPSKEGPRDQCRMRLYDQKYHDYALGLGTKIEREIPDTSNEPTGFSEGQKVKVLYQRESNVESIDITTKMFWRQPRTMKIDWKRQ